MPIRPALARLAVTIVAYAVVAPVAAAEKPSFACAGARTARERVTCGDAALAAVDRAMAAAYAEAGRRLAGPMAAVLKEDQRLALRGLTYGFDATIWFHGAIPEKRAKVDADIRRVIRDEKELRDDLRREVERRIADLIAFRPSADDFVGTWKNHQGIVWIEPAGDGTYRLDLGLGSYGWPKDHCNFHALMRRDGDKLVTGLAVNEDVEMDRKGRLEITRDGAALRMIESEDPALAQDPDAGWMCPRFPELKQTFLAANPVPRPPDRAH